MSYVISPDPAFFPMVIGTAVVSPTETYWPWLTGVPQKSIVGPSPVFWPWLMGEKVVPGIQVLTNGIPGITTLDGEFPEDLKPQHRLSSSPGGAPEYRVMYHGEPGVLRGDDNWNPMTPSYRPQLRLNTIPHTAEPSPVEGTWRVNEVFLPQ